MQHTHKKNSKEDNVEGGGGEDQNKQHAETEWPFGFNNYPAFI